MAGFNTGSVSLRIRNTAPTNVDPGHLFIYAFNDGTIRAVASDGSQVVLDNASVETLVRTVSGNLQAQINQVTGAGSSYGFSIISVSGASNITADSVADTLNFLGAGNVVIRTDPATSTIIISGGASGTSNVASFLDLTDTPNSYSGQSGRFVEVNASGTGVQFTNFRSDVANVTGSLQTQITGIDTRLGTNEVLASGLNTRVNNITANFTPLATTANISGQLNLNINTLNSRVTVTETDIVGLNARTNAISATYTPLTTTASITSNLAATQVSITNIDNRVLAISGSYTPLATTANISAQLNARLTTNEILAVGLDSRVLSVSANKADKVSGAVAGNFAALNASGNLVDSGFDETDFANAVHFHAASTIPFDPSSTTLISTDVQAAIDELDQKVASVANISGGNGLSGQVVCSIGVRTYTIGHATVELPYPAVSLVAPTSAATIFSHSIHDITNNGFRVTLSGTPSVSGYKINWQVGGGGDLLEGSTGSTGSTTIQSPLSTLLVTPISGGYNLDVSDYISRTQVSNVTGSLASSISSLNSNLQIFNTQITGVTASQGNLLQAHQVFNSQVTGVTANANTRLNNHDANLLTLQTFNSQVTGVTANANTRLNSHDTNLLTFQTFNSQVTGITASQNNLLNAHQVFNTQVAGVTASHLSRLNSADAFNLTQQTFDSQVAGVTASQGSLLQAHQVFNTQVAGVTGNLTSTVNAISGAVYGPTLRTRTVTFVVDGSTATPTVGEYSSIKVPFAGTITGWTLISDIAGSVTIDVWKANNAKPINANTITASAKPTLTAANYASSSTLTGWTTSVSANDVLTIEIESISTMKRVTLQIEMIV